MKIYQKIAILPIVAAVAFILIALIGASLSKRLENRFVQVHEEFLPSIIVGHTLEIQLEQVQKTVQQALITKEPKIVAAIGHENEEFS
jgi:hypothetical protein